jgi:arginyl-tRNA synthetase
MFGVGVMLLLPFVRAFSPNRMRAIAFVNKHCHSLFATTSIDKNNHVTVVATKDLLSNKVMQSLYKTFTELKGQSIDPMIAATSKPEFGDYQCNVAMSLAKRLKLKPKDVAEKILSHLETGDMISKAEIAGPGFINIYLSDSYLCSKLMAMSNDSTRLGISTVVTPQRVIVDFSSPNIAKEMHVGHLRSTIIGDSISRILEFLGHDVVRLNHVGDWGTQFGMLINYLKENFASALQDQKEDGSLDVKIGDLVEFYKAAKLRFDADVTFQDASRSEVVRLQRGDVDSLKAWKAICDVSRTEFQKIYDTLSINVEERGESFYNPFLSQVLYDFEVQGLLTESNGAQCVFLPGYKTGEGSDLPLIIKKSDGGFLYATTDLAAVRHRAIEEKADRVLYVTDVGQAQHFQMVFDAAKAVGYKSDNLVLSHVPFGLVLGEDGKKFKSRSGDTVKLKDLLDEAVRLAAEEIIMRENREEASQPTEDSSMSLNELTAEQLALAKVVGIGAVKYADLSMNRYSITHTDVNYYMYIV